MRYVFGLLCCVAFLVAKPAIVSSKAVQKGGLDSQNAFLGVLRFKENANIASQSSGMVEGIFFDVGERVKKGDKLVTLGSSLLQKTLEIKKAKFQQAKLLKELQEKEFLRYKNLLESDSITLQQYEKLSYDLQVQELNLIALQTEVDHAQAELELKTIRAPFDGIVVSQEVNVGEWVRVGDSVCAIFNNTQPEAIVDAPSSILPFLKKGDNVYVSINHQGYMGKISAIIPRADNRSRTFPVVIALPRNASFIDGMAVNAMLKSGGKSEGFLVPRDSVIEYRGRPSIFVVREKKAVAVAVEVLAVQGEIAVIKGNINLKDRVIYKGHYRLQNGGEVKEVSQTKQESQA